LQQYDYIIAGAGCAGLSLLQHIINEPSLAHKKICVVDKFFKNKNDRTWCFWEKEKNIFETIVAHRWKQIDFLSNTFSSRFHIAPYEYKLIRSIDFYNYVLRHAASFFPTLNGITELSQILRNTRMFQRFILMKKQISAQYIFNSILPEPPENLPGLLQHFKGWLIETNQPAF